MTKNTHTRTELEGIVLEQSRAFLKSDYGYNFDGENHVFEIHTDYQDYLNENTIATAFEKHGDNIEELKYCLYDYIYEIYLDSIGDYEMELCKEIIEYMQKNLDETTLENLEGEMLLEASEVRDIAMNNELFFVEVDADAILARSEIDMVVSLENDESQNNEFAHNSFNGGMESWFENIEEMVADGYIEESDISLITLLKTQGYTYEQLKAYALDDEQTENKFLNSLIEECENTTSSLNCLVFTIQVNLKDYVHGQVALETLPKDTVCGYVDFIHGGGSIFGIELETNVDLSDVETDCYVDGTKYRYGMKDIYGQFI